MLIIRQLYFKSWNASPYPAYVCVNLLENKKLVVNVQYFGDQPAYLRPEQCNQWAIRDVECIRGGTTRHGVWQFKYVTPAFY